MSAETYKKLAQVRLQAAATTIYTAPANTYAIIRAMLITNVSGTQTSVQMWQSGTGDANKILGGTTLQIGEYGTYDGAIALSPGETLSGSCLQNDGVTVTVEGVEIT